MRVRQSHFIKVLFIVVLGGPSLASETEETIKRLETIKAGYEAAQAPLVNLELEGRVTEVWGKVGGEEPAPVWRNFHWVVKGSRWRFECDYDPKLNQAAPRNYRVCDGTRSISLDTNAVHIFPNYKTRRLIDTNIVSRYAAPIWNREDFENVTTGMSTCIDLLRSGKIASHREILVIVEDNGLWQIDMRHRGNADLGPRWQLWINPTRGWNLVHSKSRNGVEKNNPYFEIEETSCNYTETAPGVWTLGSGKYRFERTGSRAVEQHDDGVMYAAIEVIKTRFGQFPYDDKNFTMESLPIPKGSQVLDYRKDPPVAYHFGEPPLSEEEMRKYAKDLLDPEGIAKVRAAPLTGISMSTWFILVNVVGICVLLGMYVAMRRRAH